MSLAFLLLFCGFFAFASCSTCQGYSHCQVPTYIHPPRCFNPKIFFNPEVGLLPNPKRDVKKDCLEQYLVGQSSTQWLTLFSTLYLTNFWVCLLRGWFDIIQIVLQKYTSDKLAQWLECWSRVCDVASWLWRIWTTLLLVCLHPMALNQNEN
jgi:hypothetical protein